MESKIIRLLIKYEAEIMRKTLGEEVNTVAYSKSTRWENCMGRVAYAMSELIEYGITIDPIGFAYSIISNWFNDMTFGKSELNMDALIDICKTILRELD